MKKYIQLLSGTLCLAMVFILCSYATPESYEKDLQKFERINEQYQEIICRNASGILRAPKKNQDYDYRWAGDTHWRCSNEEEIEDTDIEYVFEYLTKRKMAKEDTTVLGVLGQLDEHLAQFE